MNRLGSRHGIRKTLDQGTKFRTAILFESILIGVLVGLISVAFRFLIERSFQLRLDLKAALSAGRHVYIPLFFAGLLALGLGIGYLIKRYPLIRGSGIPQVKGALMRKIRFRWFQELIFKFLGGVVAGGAGMSLGREGPSIQLGACVGEGFFKLGRRPLSERKFLMTSGASAGLAAAFNAPIAGVMFALEELHKTFSPHLLICIMASSISADFVSRRFFGLKPIFDFRDAEVIPLGQFPWILVLGIVCSLAGLLFKKGLYAGQDLYNRLKIPVPLRPLLPMAIAGAMLFLLPEVTGGGHDTLLRASREDSALTYLLLILGVKFVFTAISYGSGSPGGIFLPMLVLGGIIGKIFGVTLVHLGFLGDKYVLNFVILGMSAFFTAVVKAPLTSGILILEMSGSTNHFLGLISICLVSFLLSDLLNSRAVYEVLLERFLQKNPAANRGSRARKILLEIPVGAGSELDHKKIKAVSWPDHCLVVGIRRGEEELIPKGDMELIHGDLVLVLTGEDTSVEHEARLLAMAGGDTAYDA